MMTALKSVCFVFVAIICLVSPGILTAFEADTHYAWTYYLALHVGYSPRQAYQIASAAYAIDEDQQTSPMEATAGDAIYGGSHPGLWSLGSEHPEIVRIWARFHAFSEANYPASLAEEARQKIKNELWLLALKEGNPGPYIHFIQDYYSHFDFDNVRGHALLGHKPDFLSNDPDFKSRRATKDTIDALSDFMQQVLKQKPRSVNIDRIWEVLNQKMVPANPAPWVTNPANFITGSDLDRIGRPSLASAIQALEKAIEEDAVSGTFGNWPDTEPYELPLNWIQYDYDSTGSSKDVSYRVEKPELNLGKEQIEIQKNEGSSVRILLRLPYEISGLKKLTEKESVPVIETQEISDFGKTGATIEKRDNGRFEITKEIQRSKSNIASGNLIWTCTVHVNGLEPITKQVIVRLPNDEPEETADERFNSRDDLQGQFQAAINLYNQCQLEPSRALFLSVMSEAITASKQDDSNAADIYNQGKEYIQKIDSAIQYLTAAESNVNQAESALNSCKINEARNLLQKGTLGNSIPDSCAKVYQARIDSVLSELDGIDLERQWQLDGLQETQSYLDGCRFQDAISTAEKQLGELGNVRCSDEIRDKLTAITKRAGEMYQIEERIDGSITIAELAILKDIPDKVVQIRGEVLEVREIIAGSGAENCFKKYLSALEILQRSISKSKLDSMNIDQYRDDDAFDRLSGIDDGWDQSTENADKLDVQTQDLTEPESNPETEEVASNEESNDEQDHDTNFTNVVDTPKKDPFIGSWNVNFTLSSHYSPRNRDGDEECEFVGARSGNKQLKIRRSGSDYFVSDGESEMQSTSVTETTLRVFNSIATPDGSVSFGLDLLVNGDQINGTMTMETSSGCRDILSLSGSRI